MKVSRRIFMRAASVAAVGAGMIVRPSLASFAQGITKSDVDPLAYYTQQTFTQYVNSIFRLHARPTVDVTLQKVQDTLPATVSRAGGRESFVLHFRGGSVALPQDTYTIEHAALGTFQLFLVPTGADANGAQGYVATINRLAYTAKPDGPGKTVPRQRLPTQRPETNSPAPPETSPEPRPARPTETVTPKVRQRTNKTDPESFPLY